MQDLSVIPALIAQLVNSFVQPTAFTFTNYTGTIDVMNKKI